MNPSEMCNGASNGGGGGDNSSSIPVPSSTTNPTNSVSPEMLYKLSKKIAQLTKVIYTLNTRNDDLSLELENVRTNLDNKIREERDDIERIHPSDPELLSSNESLKKELNRARNSLKNMEAKMAEREEENRQMIESLNNSQMTNGEHLNGGGGRGGHEESMLIEKINQLNKEKGDLIRKLDRKDVLAESLKLEREALTKEIQDLGESLSSMNLELSAARVELSYREKSGSEDLLRRLEEFSADKNNLASQLEEGTLIQDQMRVTIDDQKNLIGELEESLEAEKERVSDLNEEILRITNEAPPQNEIAERVARELQTQHETTLLDSKKFFEKEIRDLQESLASANSLAQELRASSERSSVQMQERDEEIMSLRAELSALQDESETACREIKESTLEDCQKEIEENKRDAEERIEELQSKLEHRIEEMNKELEQMSTRGEEVKCRLLESEGLLARKEGEAREKIKQLEEALEQALTEREEILLAAGDEIQNEKDIALAIEQRLMDDFEWKLREIEREHRSKLEELKSDSESQIRAANDSYNRGKDETFTKMSIDLHRDLEEKLKAERLSLKTSYEEQSHRDKESVYAQAKVEFGREKRSLEQSFGEERTKLEREVRALKRRVDDMPNEISRATASVKKEMENIEREGNVSLALLQEKSTKVIEELRQSHQTELSRTKADFQRRINDLESRLRASDGQRLDSIFKVREDVEVEFAEKMETLRDMYMGEVEKESAKVEELRLKLSESESQRRAVAERQGGELEELNSYIALREEEHEGKVNELLTRLQEQTTLAVRLQEEIDEYDWYIEDEEGNITERNPNERPPSALRGSRPPSTRPFESRIRGGSTLSLNAGRSQDSYEEVPAEEAEPKRNSLLLEPEFLEEEYIDEAEDQMEEFDSPNNNTKREEVIPTGLSKASSTSSVSYSSVTSDSHAMASSHQENESKAAPTKKHGKRSHCAQQ